MGPICTECDQPRKARKDRPGQFWSRCENHWKEYNKQSSLDRYYAKYRHEKSRLRLKSAQWDKENPKKRKAIEARYRATGAPTLWKKNNRAKVNAATVRYQHKRRAATGTYSETQWRARIAFYGGRCYLCGCDWDGLPTKSDALPKKSYKTIDHVIPLSKGGTNWPANLRPACSDCNSSKGSTHKRFRHGNQ
jgi:5-methylcytosine-specific restriction endonuclease McrA